MDGKFEAAIAQLRVNAEACENNAPIFASEGNAEQAELSARNAENYRAAIVELETA